MTKGIIIGIMLLVVVFSSVASGMPPTPTITVNDKTLETGETVYLSFSCNPNTGIYADDEILWFWWRALYDNYLDEIIYTNSTATLSNGIYTGTGSFTPPHDGEVIIQCWAHDEAGRESETAQITIEVYTGNSSSDSTPGFEFILVICAIVFLSILKGSKKP